MVEKGKYNVGENRQQKEKFLCPNLFTLLYFIVYLSFSTYNAVQNCDTLQILDFNACFYKCI